MTGVVLNETEEQVRFVNWCRARGYRLHHSPNETGSSPEARRRAVRMKRAGTSKGFPDLLVFVDEPQLAVAIEMKSTRKGAKATLEQREWLRVLSKYGFHSAICHGFEEAKDFILSITAEYLEERASI